MGISYVLCHGVQPQTQNFIFKFFLFFSHVSHSDFRYCFKIFPLHLPSLPDPLPTLPPFRIYFISNVREKNSQFSLLTLKSAVTQVTSKMVELTFDL